MPELPEVTVLGRRIDERTTGRVLAAAELANISVLKTFDPPIGDLVGRRATGTDRAGKWLVLGFEGPLYLCIHLARAGWLKWQDSVPATPARPGKGPLMLRLVYVDDGGEVAGRLDLTEAGTRKSTAVHVVRDPSQVPRIATLGPDPLAQDFTVEDLQRILTAAGRSQLKGVLREQGTIAGIGNAYSDEILHAARLSPFRPANALDAAEVADLLATIRRLLTEAIDRTADAPMTALKDGKRAGMAVHGRTGQPCPVCGDTVREVSFADSSLQYCPTCQTGGKPLADRRMSRLLK